MKLTKQLLYLLPYAFCLVPTFAQKKLGFTLKGQATNLNAPAVVLQQYFAGQRVPIDTAMVNADGSFVFELSDTLNTSMGRIVGLGRNGLDLVLDGQHIAFSLDAKDVVGTIKFKNSTENEVFFGYQRDLRAKYTRAVAIAQRAGIENEKDPRWQTRMEVFNQEIKVTVDSLYKKHPKMLATRFLKSFQEPKMSVSPKVDSVQIAKYAREHFFDNSFLNDERMIFTSVVVVRMRKFLAELPPNLPYQEQQKLFDNVIKQTTGTEEIRKYVVGELAKRVELTANQINDSLYEHITQNYVLNDPKLWDASTIQQISEMLAMKRQMAIGSVYPNLQLADIQENKRSIHDISTDYTIVYFYDPGCIHCRQKTPDLVKFMQTHTQNVTVCAITTDATEEPWREFIKTLKTDNFLNVKLSIGRLDLQKLGVYNYPTAFVLDKNKKIIARFVEPKDLTEVIR